MAYKQDKQDKQDKPSKLPTSSVLRPAPFKLPLGQNVLDKIKAVIEAKPIQRLNQPYLSNLALQPRVPATTPLQRLNQPYLSNLADQPPIVPDSPMGPPSPSPEPYPIPLGVAGGLGTPQSLLPAGGGYGDSSRFTDPRFRFNDIGSQQSGGGVNDLQQRQPPSQQPETDPNADINEQIQNNRDLIERYRSQPTQMPEMPPFQQYPAVPSRNFPGEARGAGQAALIAGVLGTLMGGSLPGAGATAAIGAGGGYLSGAERVGEDKNKKYLAEAETVKAINNQAEAGYRSRLQAAGLQEDARQHNLTSASHELMDLRNIRQNDMVNQRAEKAGDRQEANNAIGRLNQLAGWGVDPTELARSYDTDRYWEKNGIRLPRNAKGEIDMSGMARQFNSARGRSIRDQEILDHLRNLRQAHLLERNPRVKRFYAEEIRAIERSFPGGGVGTGRLLPSSGGQTELSPSGRDLHRHRLEQEMIARKTLALRGASQAIQYARLGISQQYLTLAQDPRRRMMQLMAFKQRVIALQHNLTPKYFYNPYQQEWVAPNQKNTDAVVGELDVLNTIDDEINNQMNEEANDLGLQYDPRTGVTGLGEPGSGPGGQPAGDFLIPGGEGLNPNPNPAVGIKPATGTARPTPIRGKHSKSR